MLEGNEGIEIGLINLQSAVMRHIGSDKRTLNNSMETMVLTGLIKDIGNGKFLINGNKNEHKLH